MALQMSTTFYHQTNTQNDMRLFSATILFVVPLYRYYQFNIQLFSYRQIIEKSISLFRAEYNVMDRVFHTSLPLP